MNNQYNDRPFWTDELVKEFWMGNTTHKDEISLNNAIEKFKKSKSIKEPEINYVHAEYEELNTEEKWYLGEIEKLRRQHLENIHKIKYKSIKEQPNIPLTTKANLVGVDTNLERQTFYSEEEMHKCFYAGRKFIPYLPKSGYGGSLVNEFLVFEDYLQSLSINK